jgi:hypothetical protein
MRFYTAWIFPPHFSLNAQLPSALCTFSFSLTLNVKFNFAMCLKREECRRKISFVRREGKEKEEEEEKMIKVLLTQANLCEERKEEKEERELLQFFLLMRLLCSLFCCF